MGYTKEFQERLDASNDIIKELRTKMGIKCLEFSELQPDSQQALIGVVKLHVMDSIVLDVLHENPLVLKMRVLIALQGMKELIESDIKKLEE